MTDSSSTLMIPTTYDVGLFSSNKIALWNNYYANIIFYDFKTDSYKRLFNNDTFIKGFTNDYHYYRYEKMGKPDNITSKWIFYLVKSIDSDKNGKIDNDDPSILYVSDKSGNGLKALTPENENVISIEFYDKQGFALIKMQRDLDKDNDFDSNDQDCYCIRLDLNTLTFGNKIEIKN
jgi:hypothetical protein